MKLNHLPVSRWGERYNGLPGRAGGFVRAAHRRIMLTSSSPAPKVVPAVHSPEAHGSLLPREVRMHGDQQARRNLRGDSEHG
jgi:hypothetical protein